MSRWLLISITFAIVCLGSPVKARAHRLDEYLQATRLSVERDRMGIEIDLTAGMEVAPQVFALIDTDRDGEISLAEGEAYARLVLESIELSVDGRSVPVMLIERRFPVFEEMALGVGTIRLRGVATLPSVEAGRHRVHYRNSHQSELGVYLVNALIPADKEIVISEQRRDYLQHEVTVEYRVGPESQWSSLWWLFAGLAMAGVLGVTRWSSIVSHQ